MNTVRRRQRGQAQIEYIMVIGLVSLAIMIALLGYREAVRDFTCRVIIALGGNPGGACAGAASPPAAVAVAPPSSPPAAPPPAPNPPPMPSPTPSPSPTPPVGELSGEWCVYWGGVFQYRTEFTLQPDGNYRSSINGSITLSSDRFVIQGAEGPFIRQPDGSWVDPLRYQPQGVAFARCP